MPFIVPPKLAHPMRLYRQGAGLSQLAVSQRSGIPLLRFSRIELGILEPTEAEISILAQVIGAPVAVISLKM